MQCQTEDGRVMFREKRSLNLQETPGAARKQQKQLVMESITTTLKFPLPGTNSAVMIAAICANLNSKGF